jgi:hypothetical protein
MGVSERSGYLGGTAVLALLFNLVKGALAVTELVRHHDDQVDERRSPPRDKLSFVRFDQSPEAVSQRSIRRLETQAQPHYQPTSAHAKSIEYGLGMQWRLSSQHNECKP